MEYIFFSQKSLCDEQAIRVFNSKRISSPKAKIVHRVGPHGLITNGRLVEDNGQVFAFFGAGFVGNVFLNNHVKCPDAALVAACKTAMRDPASATGTFTALVAEAQTGDAEILLDDLNSSPCFTVEHKGRFAVSNNHHMLAEWLRSQSVTPTRSVVPGLSHLVFSSGQVVGNLFEEIHLLRPEQRPAIRHGALKIVWNDPVWPGLLDATYDELIDAAASRIVDQMRVLTEASRDGHRMFDITGGMDSRIVLAALVGAGLVGEWHYQNHLAATQPDSNFAMHIAEKYGLRRMYWPFFFKEQPGFLAKARMEAFVSLGSFSSGATNIDMRRPTLIHATGMFGELGGKSQDTKRFLNSRQSTGAVSDLNTQNLIETYLASVKPLSGETGCSEALLDWARRHIAHQIDAARAHDVSLQGMPTIFYRRGKARSHFGESAHHRSMRVQFAGVLNSPYLTAASLKADPVKAAKGRVNFDLIRRLGGDDIASLPLVNDIWRKEMFDTKGQFDAFSKQPIRSGDAPMFKSEPEIDAGPDPEFEPMQAAVWDKALDVAWEAHPQRPYSSPTHLKIARYANLAHQLLKDAPMNAELAEFLPEASIRSIVSKPPEEHAHAGEAIHILQFFCFSEMWMRGLELEPFAA